LCNGHKENIRPFGSFVERNGLYGCYRVRAIA
jgi:hypothetical protein